MPDSPARPAREVAARPFLKWAGGKTQLVPELIGRSPRQIDTYYEPFLGGGAMFFALTGDPERAPKRAVLNDANRDLVTVYEVVRDRLTALLARLGTLNDTYLGAGLEERAEVYYAERARTPEDDVDKAARFIFLNKTCFNGLYRVNRRGEFNVPHGRYLSPRILDEPALRAASAALRQVEVTNGDFAEVTATARRGDFVYLDPPFEPLTKTSSFTGYTAAGFARADQLRLRWWIDDLSNRGVAVLLSNSSADWLLGIYDGAGRYELEVLAARRAINSRGGGRGPIGELLLRNYDETGKVRRTPNHERYLRSLRAISSDGSQDEVQP